MEYTFVRHNNVYSISGDTQTLHKKNYTLTVYTHSKMHTHNTVLTFFTVAQNVVVVRR